MLYQFGTDFITLTLTEVVPPADGHKGTENEDDEQRTIPSKCSICYQDFNTEEDSLLHMLHVHPEYVIVERTYKVSESYTFYLCY